MEGFTVEETKWCISVLRAQQAELVRIPDEDIPEMKMKLFKKILTNSGVFSAEDVERIKTKQDIIDLQEAMIKEIEATLPFDPEDDVAVMYLREIGANEELVNLAKNRVTPENIIRA